MAINPQRTNINPQGIVLDCNMTVMSLINISLEREAMNSQISAFNPQVFSFDQPIGASDGNTVILYLIGIFHKWAASLFYYPTPTF